MDEVAISQYFVKWTRMNTDGRWKTIRENNPIDPLIPSSICVHPVHLRLKLKRKMRIP